MLLQFRFVASSQQIIELGSTVVFVAAVIGCQPFGASKKLRLSALDLTELIAFVRG